jgi:hypothetical protein
MERFGPLFPGFCFRSLSKEEKGEQERERERKKIKKLRKKFGNSAKMVGQGGYQQINKTLNICAFEDYLDKQLKRLPKLEDVQQISPRVIRILGQNPGKVNSLTHNPPSLHATWDGMVQGPC